MRQTIMGIQNILDYANLFANRDYLNGFYSYFWAFDNCHGSLFVLIIDFCLTQLLIEYIKFVESWNLEKY